MDLNKITNSISGFYKDIAKAQQGDVLVKKYTGEDTKIATYAYIPFASIIILVFRKNNSEFVSFHARESTILLLVAVFIILLLPSFLKVLAVFAVYSIFILSAYKASKGEKLYLPLINEIANSIEI